MSFVFYPSESMVVVLSVGVQSSVHAWFPSVGVRTFRRLISREVPMKKSASSACNSPVNVVSWEANVLSLFRLVFDYRVFFGSRAKARMRKTSDSPLTVRFPLTCVVVMNLTLTSIGVLL